MSDSDASNPLMAQMRASGIPDVAIARADAMLGLLAITRRTRRRGAAPEHAGLDDFFAFALPRAHLSQSQIMQDLWVLHELGEKQGGFFVDLIQPRGALRSLQRLLDQRQFVDRSGEQRFVDQPVVAARFFLQQVQRERERVDAIAEFVFTLARLG